MKVRYMTLVKQLGLQRKNELSGVNISDDRKLRM
jgi:hypothetical protein